MVEKKYIHINDLNLRELGYRNEIDEKNCFIVDDDYHFKWGMGDGLFYYSASTLHDRIDYEDFFKLRIELGFVSAKIVEWFNRDREPSWDEYDEVDEYGTVSIKPHDNEHFRITVSGYLRRL